MTGHLVVGDVYAPRPGEGCVGRVVVDHEIRGTVYAHDVWIAEPFEMQRADFDRCYYRDATWCDGTMAPLVHPGLYRDGI